MAGEARTFVNVFSIGADKRAPTTLCLARTVSGKQTMFTPAPEKPD